MQRDGAGQAEVLGEGGDGEAEQAGVKTHFRGYGIPGALVPGTRGRGPAVEEGETLDALCGRFFIFQLKKGHRYSTDDILAAWYGTSWCPSARSILDLGSGIGTVALVAAWRLPGARVVTVEAQEDSVRLARKSVAWNGLEERFDIREGDLRDDSVLGADEKFDLVLGSPPYFPLGTGVEGDHPQKVACRFELRGTVADYCVAGGAAPRARGAVCLRVSGGAAGAGGADGGGGGGGGPDDRAEAPRGPARRRAAVARAFRDDAGRGSAGGVARDGPGPSRRS